MAALLLAWGFRSDVRWRERKPDGCPRASKAPRRPWTAVRQVWRGHVGDGRGLSSAPAVELTSRVHIVQGPNQPPKHSETPRRVHGEFQRTCEAHAQGHLGAPPVKPPPLLRAQAVTSAPRRAARWVGLCFSPSCSPSAHLK